MAEQGVDPPTFDEQTGITVQADDDIVAFATLLIEELADTDTADAVARALDRYILGERP